MQKACHQSHSLAIFGENKSPQFPLCCSLFFQICVSRKSIKQQIYGMFQDHGLRKPKQKKIEGPYFSKTLIYYLQALILCPTSLSFPCRVGGKSLACSRSAKEAVPGDGQERCTGHTIQNPKLRVGKTNSTSNSIKN